jgi:hypothetical protein
MDEAENMKMKYFRMILEIKTKFKWWKNMEK